LAIVSPGASGPSGAYRDERPMETAPVSESGEGDRSGRGLR
jgi:hypothetical protein